MLCERKWALLLAAPKDCVRVIWLCKETIENRYQMVISKGEFIHAQRITPRKAVFDGILYSFCSSCLYAIWSNFFLSEFSIFCHSSIKIRSYICLNRMKFCCEANNGKKKMYTENGVFGKHLKNKRKKLRE